MVVTTCGIWQSSFSLAEENDNVAEIRLAKIGSDKKLVLFAMFALQYRVTRLGLCSAYSLLALSITASTSLLDKNAEAFIGIVASFLSPVRILSWQATSGLVNSDMAVLQGP